MVSLDVKRHWPVSEVTANVKVEVDIKGSPSLIVLMVSVDVKQR